MGTLSKWRDNDCRPVAACGPVACGCTTPESGFDGTLYLLSLSLRRNMPQGENMPTAPPPTVPPEVHELAAELADVQPMRRGSLSERAIRCGKPGCACAEDPKSRHGPYFSLTRGWR